MGKIFSDLTEPKVPLIKFRNREKLKRSIPLFSVYWAIDIVWQVLWVHMHITRCNIQLGQLYIFSVLQYLLHIQLFYYEIDTTWDTIRVLTPLKVTHYKYFISYCTKLYCAKRKSIILQLHLQLVQIHTFCSTSLVQ